MKTFLWTVALVLAMTAGCNGHFASVQIGYQQDLGGQIGYRMDAGLDYMYDYLAPYGNWIYMEPYGYVWTPRHAGYRWRPYSDGHWISTEVGWTWIANEQWGSIPFHYGRWGNDDDLGWFWVPGREWSPAWVSWRWNDQYLGWAPLPPEAEFRDGEGFSSRSYDVPFRFWVFLQTPHFLDRDISRYTLPHERNRTIISMTSAHNTIFYRNKRIFNEGLGIDVVRKVIRRDVPRYTIRDGEQPRQARFVGNDVQIFRPQFNVQDTSRKPKNIMSREQARRDLAEARVFEPRQQTSITMQQSAVRRRQADEKNLLKKTQAQDLQVLQRKFNADMAKMPNTAEKMRIRRDHQAQKTTLQKEYQTEKQSLAKRHKEDTEQVKRVVLRKK